MLFLMILKMKHSWHVLNGKQVKIYLYLVWILLMLLLQLAAWFMKSFTSVLYPKLTFVVRPFLDFPCFSLNLLGWHWLKLYRFPGYCSTPLVYCGVCSHPKSCLLPSRLLPLYPLPPPPTPFPSNNHHILASHLCVCVFKILLIYF